MLNRREPGIEASRIKASEFPVESYPFAKCFDTAFGIEQSHFGPEHMVGFVKFHLSECIDFGLNEGELIWGAQGKQSAIELCVEQSSPEEQFEFVQGPMLELVGIGEFDQQDIAPDRLHIAQSEFVGTDTAENLIGRRDVGIFMRQRQGQTRMLGPLAEQPAHDPALDQKNGRIDGRHRFPQFPNSVSNGCLRHRKSLKGKAN